MSSCWCLAVAVVVSEHHSTSDFWVKSREHTTNTRRTLENHPPLVWVLHLTAMPRSRAGSFSRTARGFPHLHVAKGARLKSWTVRGLHRRTLLLWIRETSYICACVRLTRSHPARPGAYHFNATGKPVPWGKMSVSCDLWSSSVTCVWCARCSLGHPRCGCRFFCFRLVDDLPCSRRES